MKNDFYTLKGYQLKDNKLITEAMEDYLEMMYREFLAQKRIRINHLATSLNVKPSSVSKMVTKLQQLNLVTNEKYGDVLLTDLGIKKGAYLLWRHNVLVEFMKLINHKDYQLEQVEKIEHFIDPITMQNLDTFLKHYRNV